VNRTIDDQKGDSSTGAVPVYTPGDAWADGQTCTGCALTSHIIKASVFDGTWHDSTYHPGDPPRTISASFNGSAVYVFATLANNFGGITTFTNYTFYIDGGLVGQTVRAPASTADFIYRFPVYINTSLSNTPHNITIIGGGGPNATLILFDYIAYT
ncbi:uncharacterized protein BXZ73DRAFT_21365, partial [Epithele typhae]|uniref:uncharacterized protein n=1 Tax=Epithele typhae TaxID=378194 RepID=UPI0020086C9A